MTNILGLGGRRPQQQRTEHDAWAQAIEHDVVKHLAALIREVDGAHSLSATELAEKLLERGVTYLPATARSSGDQSNADPAGPDASETVQAKRIARHAHAGQHDKLGRDYFEAHLVPIASAAKAFGDTVTAAAWLHDVLEDTQVTAEDLKSFGVSPTLVQAVDSVTRRDGEKYTELIDRACADPVGRLVKLIDNAWNITCNPLLADADPKRAASMLKDRYEPARRRLLEACDLEWDAAQVREVQAVLDAAAVRLGR
ncbi:hypothetical protein [Mycobacteroides abscessus]